MTILAVGIASVILGISAMLMRREIGAIRFVLAMWALIAVSIPPFLATAIAQLTFEKMRPERFEPLYITPLSDDELVLGLLLSSLYQFRSWLLAAAAITPILLLLSTYVATYESLVACLLGVNSTWTACVAVANLPTAGEALVAILNVVVLLINLWLTMLFSALLGQTLTLWWRQRYFANYGATLVIALFVGFAIVSTANDSHDNSGYLLLVSVLGILIMLTYLVAQSNVRKSG